MNARQDIICRLCLRVLHNDFTLIDETAREMLEVLFVKMNFDVSNDSLMCEECAEIVKKSLSFKSVCLDSEEMILLFCTHENMKNVKLRDVYVHNTKKIVDGETEICRFCIKKVERSNFTPLDVLMKENTFSEMLKECMYEMDLNIVENPSICCHCLDNMESYFKLLQNCRDTEEKINTYKQNEGVKNTKIELNNVIEHFFQHTSQMPVCAVKKEEISEEEHPETAFSDMYDPIVKIKEEFGTEGEYAINSFYENDNTSDDVTRTRETNSSNLGCRASSNKNSLDPEDSEIKTASSEVINQHLKIEPEELNIKDEINLNESRSQYVPKSIMCICKQKRKFCLKCNSQFEVVSTRPILYKCKLCTYTGIVIKSHLLTHRDMSDVQIFQCNNCGFQTKHRSSLRGHLLTHKDLSEVPVFKCEFCDYKSKFSRRLTIHYNTHRTVAEAKLYECTTCDFKTKHHSNLRRHSLMHKSKAEVKMYKCTSCDYETKHTQSLREHALTHKDVSEVDAVKCRLCGLWCKSKRRLDDHMRRHNSKEIHKCTFCPYETRHRNCLRGHSLRHKSTAEVKMYKCKLCDFQTKYKANVGHHMVLHKDVSEIEWHECPLCPHKTRTKYLLKSHMLTHTKQRRKHHCTECDYRTHDPNRLKSHMLVHKSLSEVQTYKCTVTGCKFVTKRKCHLQRHLLTHGTVFKCEQCEFETSIKRSFSQHKLVHEEERGVEIYKCKCGYRTRFLHNLKSHRDSHKQMRYKAWRYNKEK